MTIAEAREKCKSALARAPRDILILGVIILSSTLSFGFGYMAGQDVGEGSDVTVLESPISPVVASKNGMKYYAPDCPGVNRISIDNKVWFASADAARAQGYTPASNCDGL